MAPPFVPLSPMATPRRAFRRCGTEGSNPTLGSFVISKNTKDSAIIDDQINGFCPRFCPRRKAIKDPGWCGLDAPGQQFIHRPRTWLSQPTWPKTSKTLPKPWPPSLPSPPSSLLSGGSPRQSPRPAIHQTKVGKSHSKGTFAGAFGNDGDAPVPALRAPRWNRRTRALGHLRLPGRMLADRARSACTQSHNTRRCHDEVAGYGPHVSVFAY